MIALSAIFRTGTIGVDASRLVGRTGSVITATTVVVAAGAIFGSVGMVNGNIAVAGTLSPDTMTVADNVTAPTATV